MAGDWIDVSVPVRTGMVHWPGNPAVRLVRTQDTERGDPCTVSAMELGVHTGTHMDSPLHFIRGGGCMDTMPLDATVGPARVVAIRDSVSIKPRHLEPLRLRAGERILFKTLNSARCWKTDRFVDDFVYISADAASWLADRRVRMVGVDYLSVGGFHADGIETHRHLLGAGIWIVEGLNLEKVRPGRVDLVCLPVRIPGADGAPARAILRPRRSAAFTSARRRSPSGT